MVLKTYRSISAHKLRISLLLLLLGLPFLTSAQDLVPAEAKDSTTVVVITKDGKEKPAKKAKKKKDKKEPSFFYGVAVGADILGPILKVGGSDWRQFEVMARVNLLDKYFPIFEMGIGEADHEGHDLDNHFSVRAPYFRIGADYNFTKKHNGNRLLLGLRYGFSTFNYDLDAGTPLSDPVWKTQMEVNYKDLHCQAHWAEVVFGVETRLWTIIHAGWDLRVKFRISEKDPTLGQPWFVPGYGKNDTSCWGGSFKILIDI